MRPALSVTWATLRDWYYNMLSLASINVLWFVLSLTVVLLPPATAGMYAATNRVAHGTGQRLGDFWDGARRSLWLSLRWAAVNIVVAAILWSNTLFYSSLAESAAFVVRALIGSLALVWLATQFYLWPFLMEQDDKRLRVALKNALFLTLATPVYTFTLLIIVVLFTLISVVTVLPLAVFLMSFVSLLGNRAVLERLTFFGKLPQPSGGNNDGSIDHTDALLG